MSSTLGLWRRWQRATTRNASELCSRSCRRALTSWGGSSSQLKEREGSHCRTCAHTATHFRVMIRSGGTHRENEDSSKSKRKHCNWWCAACGGQCNWSDPNRVLVFQDSVCPSEAKVSRTHALPQGTCENHMCGLSRCWRRSRRAETASWTRSPKVLSGTEQDETHEGAEEDHRGGQEPGGKDRRTREELGGNQGGQIQFNIEMFLNAITGEGVEELTLREGEEGMLRSFISTINVEDSRPGSPLVDEDCHAICQAIYKGSRWSGMGEFVQQVRGGERSQRPSLKWKQQGQEAVEDKRHQGEMRRVLRPDQRAEDRKSGNGSTGIVEQTLADSSTGPGWSVPRRQEGAEVEWTLLLSPFETSCCSDVNWTLVCEMSGAAWAFHLSCQIDDLQQA